MSGYMEHVPVRPSVHSHRSMFGTLPTCPLAEATHQEVLNDSGLFRGTLDRLLAALGIIKRNIPKVGGQSMDLHLLYKVVTGLGGLGPVISRKQWVMVCELINFSPSFTNKSFVTRRLYIAVLHHYEEVYFHRNQGPLVAPPSIRQEDSVPIGGLHGDPYGQKRRYNSHDSGTCGPSFPVQGTTTGFMTEQGNTALPPGTCFTGSLDSSFHPGDSQDRQQQQHAQSSDGAKRQKPVEPIQPRSPVFYCAKDIPTAEVRAMFPDDDVNLATFHLAAMCLSKMSAEDMKPFVDESQTDIKRYEEELERPPQREAVAQGSLESHIHPPTSQLTNPSQGRPIQASLDSYIHPVTTLDEKWDGQTVSNHNIDEPCPTLKYYTQPNPSPHRNDDNLVIQMLGDVGTGPDDLAAQQWGGLEGAYAPQQGGVEGGFTMGMDMDVDMGMEESADPLAFLDEDVQNPFHADSPGLRNSHSGGDGFVAYGSKGGITSLEVQGAPHSSGMGQVQKRQTFQVYACGYELMGPWD
eukprot:gene30284-35272_t